MLNKNILIKKYFDEYGFAESDIKSYNNFVDKSMQEIVNEMSEIIPTIIPPEMQNFKIKLDKIWITKPVLVEADGSKRDVFPTEARLRQLTYSAPINIEVSAHIDGVQRESFITPIGRLPIMVKSKYCHLSSMKREELIKHGEDPDDPGGYFILNGNERVLITVEDLIANKMFLQKNKVGPSRITAKMFSERGSYRVPHTIEQMKDGIFYLSFTRFRRIPLIPIIKALGLVKDQEIVNAVSKDKQYDEVFINLYNFVSIKTEEDALEYISKQFGIINAKEEKYEKTKEQLDRYLLPHLGLTDKPRLIKAYNLCKYIKKFIKVSNDEIEIEEKDHYMNKKLKLSGDLLSDLFRVNLRILINDILYNFQRLVKRGKYQSMKITIRDKLLTSRIQSAMATGNWVGGRKGVSQNMDRANFLASLSHIQRIVSLLSSAQENFDARALHPTHFGRLCAIETPEGTTIGLRKNLALMCSISQDQISSEKLKKMLTGYGFKSIVK